jgi:hypothetical protein
VPAKSVFLNQPVYLPSLIAMQSTTHICSANDVIALKRPSVSFRLKISDLSFYYCHTISINYIARRRATPPSAASREV